MRVTEYYVTCTGKLCQTFTVHEGQCPIVWEVVGSAYSNKFGAIFLHEMIK